MSLAARDLPRRMTADEFFALPESDELRFAQLVDGELVFNTPAARHNRLVLHLAHSFMTWADSQVDPGEGGFNTNALIDEHNVFTPDLWWVPAARQLGARDTHFEVPPPLVVEVRSPSTWRYDIGTKLRHYEGRGVAEVWLVDGEVDTVHIHRRRTPAALTFDLSLDLGRDDVLTTPLVPGWQVDLEALFSV